MTDSTLHPLELTADQWQSRLKAMGLQAFRARQVFQWIWAKRTSDYAAMTNLGADLRKRLAEEMPILTGEIVRRSEAADGVSKLLLQWPDGEQIETVLIPTAPGEATTPRRTACISTQVGCAVGCAFCASGMNGVSRDLTAGEIVEQAYRWDVDSPPGERLTHVVIMGMGEPLANYEATVEAVRILIDPDRGGLSGRHITLSTVGLPGKIRRLAGEGIPLTLAISLHAPNDELRRQLIPLAKSISIAELLNAGREYFDRTGRELTFEYILLAGVNDSHQCADELAQLARRVRCNVNLIRYNPVEGLPFHPGEERTVLAFRDRLARKGVNVHIRASRGRDVDAACGQLRRRAESS